MNLNKPMKAAKLALESDLQGEVLSHCGNPMMCFIATKEYLYFGKRQIGATPPINLMSFQWECVTGLHFKKGNVVSSFVGLPVTVTVTFSKAVADLAANAATGAILLGGFGILAAMAGPKNQLTLQVPIKRIREVEELAGHVKSLVASARESPPSSQGSVGGNIADELERLVKLKESGALSEAEFEAAKRKVL